LKFFIKTIPAFIALSILYLAGPAPEVPNLNGKLPEVSSDLIQLEKEIIENEESQKNVKPDNEARIVWANSTNKQKTPYAIVYLHGFSASQEEGNPLHRDFAERYGCNLYLARLYGHGLNEKEAMVDLTPENLMESAKYAVAVGKQLGEKVILMSTSTGGTLSLYIAGENPDIAGLILYSPNIDLYDRSATILNKNWGLQIARLVMGGNYMINKRESSPASYWTKKYRLEALISLRSLLDATMQEEVFEKIKQPVFLGYFYKNEEVHDKVVSVPAMLEMYDQIKTPVESKRKIAFKEVGDHCLANRFKSKDLDKVKKETFRFAEEVLKLTPKIQVAKIN